MKAFLKKVLEKIAYYSRYDIEILSKRIEEFNTFFYGENNEGEQD